MLLLIISINFFPFVLYIYYKICIINDKYFILSYYIKQIETNHLVPRQKSAIKEVKKKKNHLKVFKKIYLIINKFDYFTY